MSTRAIAALAAVALLAGCGGTSAAQSHAAQVAACTKFINSRWNDLNPPPVTTSPCDGLTTAEKQAIVSKLIVAHGGSL